MALDSQFPLHRPELAEPLEKGEAAIRKLMERSLTLESGATLVQADTDHSYVYRVREGWAGRVRNLPDGRAQFILIFLPGDLFAVKSMFVSRHPDAIVALSKIVVERVPYKRLRAAYDQDPSIALRCTWQVVEEERRLHNWVVSLGQGNAEERAARVLNEFRGRLIVSGSIPADATSFILPMTQEQLADHIGVSPVHMNRTLKSLRDANLVTIKGRTATIHDPSGLSQLAHPLFDTFERNSPAYNSSHADQSD